MRIAKWNKKRKGNAEFGMRNEIRKKGKCRIRLVGATRRVALADIGKIEERAKARLARS
jgi:hypothetical protein